MNNEQVITTSSWTMNTWTMNNEKMNNEPFHDNEHLKIEQLITVTRMNNEQSIHNNNQHWTNMTAPMNNVQQQSTMNGEQQQWTMNNRQ